MFAPNDDDQTTLDKFTWLVENRSRNQKATLDLYRIFVTYKSKLSRSRRHRGAGQMLLGVAFSLWRAVFLNDIKQERGTMLDHAERFLQELIKNNAITYQVDQKYQDWTFRYYVQNARERLKTLNSSYRSLGISFGLPGESVGKTPQEWWEIHQDALEIAIAEFEHALTQPKPPRKKKANSN